MKPRLLDLFCGAGGAAMGYHRAGFDVVGVDIAPQPHYPFMFVRADAMSFLENWLAGNCWPWPDAWGICRSSFSAIHASPPCQFATAYRRTGLVGEHDNLISATRELLDATNRQHASLPYVIENVEDARAHLIDPVLLCGSMFDLDVKRHRLFETNWQLDPPEWPCRHGIWAARLARLPRRCACSLRSGSWRRGRRIPLDIQKRAMGVDHAVTREELSQAIPPAYTDLIGHQLMQHVLARAAA